MSVQTPGQKVREAREALGLSRPELATQASVSRSTIDRLELNDRLPGVLALSRITAALSIDLGAVVDAARDREPAA